ncbi:hypothetical protein, partial [Sporosarcina sp. JAI121]|uniref:hypothetical protein n=1 Tax=Sporosarcina sp. JAI121 TaxID=2723064 RepID=UPI001C547575
ILLDASMVSLETLPFVGHFSGLVADYPKLVGHSMDFVGYFDSFVEDLPDCCTLSGLVGRLPWFVGQFLEYVGYFDGSLERDACATINSTNCIKNQ